MSHYKFNFTYQNFVRQFVEPVHPLYRMQGDTKKRELLKNPTKIEEIQEKKFIDRN